MANAILTDSTAVTISGGGLTATNTGTTSTDQGARSHTTKNAGKFYFEVTLTTLLSGDNVGVGVATHDSSFTNIGNNATTGSMMYPNFGGGAVYANGSQVPAAALGARLSGDVIGIAVDCDNDKIWFKKVNGTPTNWNGSLNGDPASGTGSVTLTSTAIEPICAFGGGAGNSGNSFDFNFGDSAFTGSLPSGFTSGWPVPEPPVFPPSGAMLIGL